MFAINREDFTKAQIHSSGAGITSIVTPNFRIEPRQHPRVGVIVHDLREERSPDNRLGPQVWDAAIEVIARAVNEAKGAHGTSICVPGNFVRYLDALDA